MEKHTATYIAVEPIDTEESDDRVNTEASHRLPIDIYERMCAALYAYRFGRIGFLDLLTQFEEILGIESPQTDNRLGLDTPGRKEL